MRLKSSSRLTAAVMATAALTLAGAPSALATVTVSVDPDGKLKGTTAILRVTVTCDAGDEVLEANLTLSQDDQAISGTGGIPGVRCDGRPHKSTVRVTAQNGTFHTGAASASAFVLVLEPAGTTEQGQASQTVNLR